MRIRPLATAVAFGLAFAGCSNERARGGDGGGTLLIAMPAEPASLFPLLADDETSTAITSAMFEKLAKIDDRTSTFGDAGFKPRLARSWDWAADSMTITFHLDPKARFHDGTPVLASDVAFTHRIARDTALGSSFTSLIANIDSVSVVDSLTPKFWFHRRSPTQFYDAVYQLAPVPEHIYGKVKVSELKTAELTRTPVGSGRFRFVRWEPGVRIEVIADTANFLGRAKVDRVVFMLGQAPVAAAASVRAGQLDFVSAIPVDQAGAIDSGDVARTVPYRQNGYGFLVVNTHDPKSPRRPHPILSDVAVRRAIAMGIDRQAMITNIFRGLTTTTEGPFPAGSVLADSSVHAPKYDTTAAKAALDGAGWHVGPKGVREKNGRPLALEILVPTSSIPRVRYAELIQEQLNKLGFRIELARAAPPQFGPRFGPGDYDLTLISVNTDPTIAGVQQFWSGAGLAAGSNFSRYQSAFVDAKLDSASRATTSAEVKRLAAAAYQRIIDDVPAVWLYSAATVAAVNRRVELAPLPLDGWWGNLADWSIPADKRIDRDRIGLGAPGR